MDTKPAAPTSLVSTLANTAYSTITRVAELAVTRVMANIQVGRLKILDYPSGRVYLLGSSSSSTSEEPVELRVISPTFWLRLFLMGDLGFSESYMYGEVSLPHTDLIPLFRLFLANRPYLSTIDGSSWVSTPQRVLNGIWARNTLTGSRKNISAHYDISNRMFEGFLSRDMTYSCALWDEVDGDLVGGGEEENVEGILRIGSTQKPAQTFTQAAGKDEEDPLYEAQMNKLRYIISLLRIPNDTSEPIRVLEIGSGWGSLSILLASTYPHVHIDTLTLSTQQKSLADERIRASGLSDRVKVHLMDYRQIPVEWKGKFHRVVSVEMVEAVGEAYLSTYFAQIDTALHPTRGIGVVQSITIPEARFKNYQKEVDFIQKWIFPGGFLPSLTVLMNAMELGSQGRLTVDGVRNIGVHYARTLREWRRRFLGRFEEVVRPALEEERGVKGEEEVEVFKRKWIYYYCYCEIGFSERVLGDHVLCFSREGCGDMRKEPSFP